ncbi:TPA: hypothetical protein KO277_002365 [Clostridioides difficile]|nr:hypothetical protein [Clostridioides difficile]
MYNLLIDIYVSMISSILGVSLKDIRKVLRKEKLKNEDKSEISDSIDVISKNLEESKIIIEEALLEMEKQKEIFAQMKKEAEISQQVSSMNKEQVTALNELLQNTLDKQERQSFPKNQLWNLFFCIFSAVLGFLLGKYL